MTETEVARLYRDAVVIDALGPIFWYQEDKDGYLKAVHQSGLTAFSHTMILPYDTRPDGFMEFVGAAEEWRRMSETWPQYLTVATTAEDIRRAKSEGKVAVVFSLQNPYPVGTRLERLAGLYRMGLRIFQLTYQKRSYLADGCGEPTDAGLSDFGRAAIKEMNRLGILVDLAHAGRRSSMEAMEVSDQPVVVTHACVHALTRNPRNLTDEMIDTIAAKGGVIGVAGSKKFVAREGRSFIDAFLDHVDYLVERAGENHVGIGLDLAEGIPETRVQFLNRTFPELGRLEVHYSVPEIDTPAKLPALAERLAARGHSPQAIRKILGGNFLRVFDQVWH